MMKRNWIFDQSHYKCITNSRVEFLKTWLPDLITAEGIKSALDVGCAVGEFSHCLTDLGLEVVAFDGRAGNVEEAQRRYGGIKFIVHDIEDSSVKNLGDFDLLLCFGLLYHLENPFLAIRNLHALTGKILLIESMITPSFAPGASLVDEWPSEDQSLNYVSLVPSESGLVKMLYRAGFPYLYSSLILPDHIDYLETLESHRKRTIIVASKVPLRLPFLRAVPEPMTKNLWLKPIGSYFSRLYRFFRKPLGEKRVALRFGLKKLWFWLIPLIPLPIHLPYGGWWLARDDTCSDAIFANVFEEAEWRFVANLLRKGGTVLDIGAHHGFYTILAAKRVGPSGRVIAFEPSPRERERLSRHLKLNRCSRVKVEPLALTSEDGEATLNLVDGRDTGCNSLRFPAISEPTKAVTVKTMALDHYLAEKNISHVDFIKMDVEGAELEVLKGAGALLTRIPRPILMVEIQDIRTAPWGYPASFIYDFLAERGFQWFAIDTTGTLKPSKKTGNYETNLVAVPEERVLELDRLIEA